MKYAMIAVLGLTGGAVPAWAQFSGATVTINVGAKSSLFTEFGSGMRDEHGGGGAYPLYLGSVNANQSIGGSNVFAEGYAALEMSETGVSANGHATSHVEGAAGIMSGTASSESLLAVTFTIDASYTWKISSGSAAGAKAWITLSDGFADIFSYNDTGISDASGTIGAGTYTLHLSGTASSDWEINAGAPESASYTLGFELAKVIPCPADLNRDRLVNDDDFLIFVAAYDILDCADPSMPAGCGADLNSDAVVDDADFSIFALAYDALLCP